MRFLGYVFGVLAIFVIVGLMSGLWIIHHYSENLPDYRQLAVYEPPITTRFQAGDGSLLAEYAREKRLFVPISEIPKLVRNAFISAEDKNFYEHLGVDPMGLLRAVLVNIKNMSSGRRPEGASTITQQVAKNFLLGNEMSIGRKIREAILAFRIEHAFSKDKILELYLNEIYLGSGAYGVAAAALTYFDKPLNQLTPAECAFLGALPKAPSNYNPVRDHDAALARRNWVLDRMHQDGHITRQQWLIAKASPLETRHQSEAAITHADYFAEEVRREIVKMYGEKALYEGGLSVRTTLDPKFQAMADKAFREDLIAYDRRHGWRGPLAHVDLATGADWQAALKSVPAPVGLVVPGINPWTMAIVLSLETKKAEIGFADGTKGAIPMAQMTWARPTLPNQRVGATPRRPSKVLKAGDVVAVEPLPKGKTKGKDEAKGQGEFILRQIPNVEGGMLVMDPHTGRVLAMVGGWSFAESQFNRATQAMRQPGSSFKPYVFATAFENGLTPSTLVMDEPFVASQGPGLPLWKPENYEHDFMGPITMRVALEHSRNLVTARVAFYIGMDKIAALADRFGVYDNLAPYLANSLVAAETTVLRQAMGYSEFVNGGKKVTPTFIDRVQDRWGHTIFKHDTRPCDGCNNVAWYGQSPPVIPDTRERVIDAGTAYQIVSLMQGVVDRGTGVRVRAVGKPLAGKTGTSNDAKDTWFVGFSPDLVAGVYVGFDQPRTLGRREQGALTAAPAFRDFMAMALANTPPTPFRIPPGLRLVRVNPTTGQPAAPGEKAIWEAFKPGTEPKVGVQPPILDGTLGSSGFTTDDQGLGQSPLGDSGISSLGGAPMSGAATGGLY